MAGLELLEKYDISLTDLNLDALVKLRAVYESDVTALVGERDSQETTDSELKKFLLSVTSDEDEVAKAVKTFTSDVREMFYKVVDANPRTIFALVEAISEIKTDVLNERDHWLNKVKRQASPVKVVDADYEAKREDAANLAELIRQLYPLLASFVPTDKNGESYGPDNFPLEPKKEGGKPVPGAFLPKLSRLPRSDSGDSPSGRAASNRYLVFTWQGNEIPEGTLPSDVAHDYVSDFKSGYVIDWTGIRDLAKKDGVEMFTDTVWSHDFPTGTLTVQDKRPDKPKRKSD